MVVIVASATVVWLGGYWFSWGQHARPSKCHTLFALPGRFTLHALALGSPRAVAELWSRFVSTLRLTYWEQLQPLPRMRLEQQQQGSSKAGGKNGIGGSGSNGGGGSNGGSSGPSGHPSRPEAPNLELCLLHQKLQLLDLCIYLQGQRQQAQQDGGLGEQQGRPGSQSALDWEASWGAGDEEGEQQGQLGSQAVLEWEASWGDGDSSSGREQQPHSPASSSSSYHSARAGSEASLSPVRERQQQHRQRQQQTADEQPRSNGDATAGELAAAEARGAVGVLPGATLHLHPDRPLRIPAVQELPVHTEDTLAESQAALQVDGL